MRFFSSDISIFINLHYPVSSVLMEWKQRMHL